MTTKISYTVSEAVKATGFSEWTIRAAIESGHLSARRKPYPDGTPNPKGMYVIFASDLEAWITEWPAA